MKKSTSGDSMKTLSESVFDIYTDEYAGFTRKRDFIQSEKS